MNKFQIADFIYNDSKFKNIEYKGPMVILSCISDPSMVLFFPFNINNPEIMNFLLQDENYKNINENTNVLGIYKTMIDSWKNSDRYLSGIIMDSVYDKNSKDDVLSIKLVISNEDGMIDSLAPISFVHAIILSVLEECYIVINDDLLNKLVDLDDEDAVKNAMNKKSNVFPEDKKILKIVKDIMSGKIKED